MPLELHLRKTPLGIHVACGSIDGAYVVRGEPTEMASQICCLFGVTFSTLPRLVPNPWAEKISLSPRPGLQSFPVTLSALLLPPGGETAFPKASLVAGIWPETVGRPEEKLPVVGSALQPGRPS